MNVFVRAPALEIFEGLRRRPYNVANTGLKRLAVSVSLS